MLQVKTMLHHALKVQLIDEMLERDNHFFICDGYCLSKHDLLFDSTKIRVGKRWLKTISPLLTIDMIFHLLTKKVNGSIVWQIRSFYNRQIPVRIIPISPLLNPTKYEFSCQAMPGTEIFYCKLQFDQGHIMSKSCVRFDQFWKRVDQRTLPHSIFVTEGKLSVGSGLLPLSIELLIYLIIIEITSLGRCTIFIA